MILPATAYVGLGSNLGDRHGQISDAMARIAALDPTLGDVASSRRYASLSVPRGEPEFINAVVAVKTRLPPHRFLDALHGVEAAMGRVRTTRWAPRFIDLDLIAWVPEGLSCSVRRDAPVVVPHPRAHLRDFVLLPLGDVAGALRLRGQSIAALQAALPEADRSVLGPVA